MYTILCGGKVLNENWIIIKITEKMKNEAKKDKYKEIGEKRGTPDHVLRSSRFWAGENQIQNYISNLGELAFKDFIERNNIFYREDNLHQYRGDFFDFMIDKKKIDIKTGHLSWDIEELQPGYNFFIAQQQCKKDMDYYVNIQLDPPMTHAYIIGFISKEEIKEYSVVKTNNMVNPAIAIPLLHLHPIYELIQIIKKKKKKIKQITIEEILYSCAI